MALSLTSINPLGLKSSNLWTKSASIAFGSNCADFGEFIFWAGLSFIIPSTNRYSKKDLEVDKTLWILLGLSPLLLSELTNVLNSCSLTDCQSSISIFRRYLDNLVRSLLYPLMVCFEYCFTDSKYERNS